MPSDSAQAVDTSVTANAWASSPPNRNGWHTSRPDASSATASSTRASPPRFIATAQAINLSADSTIRTAPSAVRKEGTGKLTVPARSESSPSENTTAGTHASSPTTNA
ncbi:hypothetical protein [Arthrobacter sp. 9AX]|uniref:hypothetical protein n=1 Tax=Arthrobacter sp. 9AX TaxID=2653131 RepID=UPI001F2C95A3|nr:hypothetical protein [Arthrobacter sp. 9AX]